MDSTLNKFSAIDPDNLCESDDDIKIQPKNINKSGYERPHIDTEAIWAELTKSFLPNQTAFEYFLPLLTSSTDSASDTTVKPLNIDGNSSDESDELTPDEHALLDKYDLTDVKQQMFAYEELTAYMTRKQQNNPNLSEKTPYNPQKNQNNQKKEQVFPILQWAKVTPDGHIIKKILEPGLDKASHASLLAAVADIQDTLTNPSNITNISPNEQSSDNTIPASLGINTPISISPDTGYFDNIAAQTLLTHTSPIPPIPLESCLPSTPQDVQCGRPPALSRVYGLLSVRVYDLSKIQKEDQMAKHVDQHLEQSSEEALQENQSYQQLLQLEPDLIYSSLHEEVSIMVGHNQSLRALEVAVTSMNVGERALILSSSKYGGNLKHIGHYKHSYEHELVEEFTHIIRNDSSQQKLSELLTNTLRPTVPNYMIPPNPIKGQVTKNPEKYLTTSQLPQFIAHNLNQPNSVPIFELTKSSAIVHNITYNMVFAGLRFHKQAMLAYEKKIRNLATDLFQKVWIDAKKKTVAQNLAKKSVNIDDVDDTLTTYPNIIPITDIDCIDQLSPDLLQKLYPSTKSTLIPPFEGCINVFSAFPMKFFDIESNSVINNQYRIQLHSNHSQNRHLLNANKMALFEFPMALTEYLYLPLLNDKHFYDIITSSVTNTAPTGRNAYRTSSLQLTSLPYAGSQTGLRDNSNSVHTIPEGTKHNDNIHQNQNDDKTCDKVSSHKSNKRHTTPTIPTKSPTVMYEHDKYIIELDFTLTRFEKEVNLHQMERSEKVLFLQQRRHLAKLLYQQFHKIQSALAMYSQGVMTVESDQIAHQQSYEKTKEKQSFEQGELSMGPNSSLYGLKEQVLPQLTPIERKNMYSVLYTNMIQCCYGLPQYIYRQNNALFYIDVLLNKFNDLYNIKALYYQYKVIWGKDDVSRAARCIETAVTRCEEVIKKENYSLQQKIKKCEEKEQNSFNKTDETDGKKKYNEPAQSIAAQKSSFALIQQNIKTLEGLLKVMKNDRILINNALRKEQITNVTESKMLKKHRMKSVNVNTTENDSDNRGGLNKTKLENRSNLQQQFANIGLYDDKPLTASVKNAGSWGASTRCEGVMTGLRLAGHFLCQQVTYTCNQWYDYYFGKHWSYRGMRR